MMTPQEFKQRWESDEHGGGITYNDIAECAKAWGITDTPKTKYTNWVISEVLKKAGTVWND